MSTDTNKTPKGATLQDSDGWIEAFIGLNLNEESVVEAEDATIADEVNKMVDTGFREASDITLTIADKPSNYPAVGGADKTYTLTYPLRTGQSSADTRTWTGYVKSIGRPTMERGGTRMVVTITLRVNSIGTTTVGS